MLIDPLIFKAYDVRGIYPGQINEKAVYKIAQAYCQVFKPKGAIVLGKDVRLSSPDLWQSAAKGITNAGYDVIDIGTVSTDMFYFAVAFYKYAGGIMITASHNPRQYNGMKFVREKAIAIAADTGLEQIKKQALKSAEILEPIKGDIIKKNIMLDYSGHCLRISNLPALKPMAVAADANNGMAGVVVKKILKNLPIKIIELNFQPDGRFPKGRPDPKIPERRKEIEDLVIKAKTDLGIAWDGDADRCFFFDEKGRYVDPYYITSILAEYFLKEHKGAKVLCDVRLIWAIKDTVKKFGGHLIINRPGHAFIKDKMRQDNILFGGETSGHYYFKENFYADNGIIPFLLILKILHQCKCQLSEIADKYRNKYFISGEINKNVSDADIVIKNAAEKYKDGKVTHIDGVSVEFKDWRFNLRKSNTEPLIRLNVEAKSQRIVDQKVKELLKIIK